MRAAVYESFGGAITVNEVERPAAAAGELVVEVLAVGLCRSDYHGWHGTDPDIVCPHVGGHEFVGRIVAVGTTSLRLLESAAAEDGTMSEWQGDTSIFITPGYRFRAVDLLMTNFHLPRSTLLVMIDAFVGPRWRTIYDAALADELLESAEVEELSPGS